MSSELRKMCGLVINLLTRVLDIIKEPESYSPVYGYEAYSRSGEVISPVFFPSGNPPKRFTFESAIEFAGRDILHKSEYETVRRIILQEVGLGMGSVPRNHGYLLDEIRATIHRLKDFLVGY